MAQETNGKSKGSTRFRKLLKGLRVWIFWRIPGFSFWYWLVAIQGRKTELPLLGYCWVLCLLPFVGQLFSKYRRFVVVFPVYLPIYYFAFFPIATIVDVNSILRPSVQSILKALKRITRWTTTSIFLLAEATVYCSVVVWLSLSENPEILWSLAWISLVLGGLLVALLAARWIVNPFALPRSLIGILLRLVRGWGSYRFNYQFSDKATRESLNHAGTWLNERLLDETDTSGVSKLVRHFCVPVSLAALAFLFLALSLSCGFTYYAIWESRGVFAAGDPIVQPTLLVALYYALSVGVTAPSSILTPIAWPAFLVQAIQHAASVFVVALIPAALFFNLSARHNEYLLEIRRDIVATRDHLRALWNKSVSREETAKRKSANREKPGSLSEAIYRLVSLFTDSAGSGSSEKTRSENEPPSQGNS